MGYADCKFYDKLEVLIDLLCKDEITQEVFDKRSLEYLDSELDPLFGGEWLAAHYDSTADFILESLNEGEPLARPFDEMVANARKEIEIFRKHGYNDIADRMVDTLNESIMSYEVF